MNRHDVTSSNSEPSALSGGDEVIRRGLAAPPIVGRVAGLSADALEPLSSRRLAAILRARAPLLDEISEIRAWLVATIQARLTEFDRPTRRGLLAIKRDCFNARPTRKYRTKPAWTALSALAADAAQRLAWLEDQIRDHDAAFAAAYDHELARERLHVLDLLDNADLVRGIAIGRAGLVEKARGKARQLVTTGCARPTAKWEESVLRFVTRAATKLSASSTLTTYALGSLRESAAPSPAIHWFEAGRVRSLVRIDRPHAEQFQALLFEHPAVRRHALVTWNDSAEEVEPGTFRYLRDRYWKLDRDAGEMTYAEPARIKVKCPESLRVTAVRAALADEDDGLLYRDLLDRLDVEGNDAEISLERLLSIGLLTLGPPWPTHEPWLERRLLDFLSSIAEREPDLVEITDALGKLVALEESFAEAAQPEQHVADMQRAFVRLMHKATPGSTTVEVTRSAVFYDDVLQEPAAEPALDRGLFAMDASAADKMLDVVGSIACFDSLFHFRHDVVHTLIAWWRAHEPSRRAIPFNELAARFATTWATFLDFHKTADDNPCEPWDPCDSPALAHLRDHRTWAQTRVRELVASAPNKDFLSAESIASLVESLPDRYRPMVGVSVFCQPIDAGGSRWVLNNINPGTGRYLSRVVPTLQRAHQKRFLAHLVARSTLEVDGDDADLLEVKHPSPHLVRAHPPQTARVLDLRGLHLDLPPERKVQLDELVVRADLEAETLRLVDRTGRRVLPVSLSTVPNAGLSNKLRLLLMFGPGETRSMFPPAWTRTTDGVTTFERLTCGPVVLRRKGWLLPVDRLRQRTASLDEAARQRLIDVWRRRYGLPNTCFYRERASCGKDKPQFLRFDSPSLCRLFVRSLHTTDAQKLSFSEALPDPSTYPVHPKGERRALELLIDQLSIRGPRGSSSVG